ncbi:putative l-type lectin-domain containing receptor kinase i.6 [Quercus suber]|uniref:L-type lectin-domain containing receptor kinase i.6 n=1 Tax=Quercus suber TaxID=58331 RepID=A0AAW0J2U4_QUESU
MLMAMVLHSLQFLIILCVYFICLGFAQNEDQFIYNGFHQANLHLEGSAQIYNNGLLQLSSMSLNQVGYAFYKLPLKFNTSSSSGLKSSLLFSTNFVFAMVRQFPNIGGHGITFTISPSKDFPNASAHPFLGLFNFSNDGLATNHILAIELDTLKNDNFGDIDDNHVGIDVNGLQSVEAATAMKKYEEIREDWEREYGPHRFTYKNLYKATKGFSDKELLGVGELTRTGRATTCTDVFAFGAFVLEVACGRRPIDIQGLPAEMILVDYVFQCWRKGAILDASDPRLEGSYVKEEMELVLKIGLFCSQSMPAARPSMRQVMQFLDGDADLPELPHDDACFGTPTNSEAYGLSLFPSSSQGSAPSMTSTDSILRSGR